MQLAAQLLDSTTHNVKSIASELGYRDALYFSRVFTGIHGVSPTEYRRRRQLG
jgi:AraC-like DNA-binding protein